VFDVDDDQRRAAEAGVAPNGFSFDGTEERDLDGTLHSSPHHPWSGVSRMGWDVRLRK
jgi:hypothetical protein